MNSIRTLSFFLMLMPLLSVAQTLTDGLVFLLNFNGNMLDESGNDLHLIEFGPTLTEDRFGNTNGAYFWDGIDDYLEIPSSPLIKIDPPVTFALWVKAESVEQHHMKFFKTDLNAMDYNGYFLSGYPPFIGSSDILMSTGGGIGHTGPDNRRSKQGSSITANTWHHLACIIRSPTDMDLYVDCENVGGTYTGSGPMAISHTNATGRLGSVLETVGGPQTFYWGAMDQFAMWGRALTAADVTKICDGQLETDQLTDVPESDPNTEIDNSVSGGQTIRVFPVPAEQTIVIGLNFDLNQPVVMVKNSAGQNISDFKILTMENRKFTLDIHCLPAGIYYGIIQSPKHNLRFSFVRQ